MSKQKSEHVCTRCWKNNTKGLLCNDCHKKVLENTVDKNADNYKQRKPEDKHYCSACERFCKVEYTIYEYCSYFEQRRIQYLYPDVVFDNDTFVPTGANWERHLKTKMHISNSK